MFYTCQLDGWSWIHNPDVEWYEMHIYCAQCLTMHTPLQPQLMLRNGVTVGILKIEQPEIPPVIEDHAILGSVALDGESRMDIDTM